MKMRRSRYIRHRFPPAIISHAVWLYYRFSLNFREVEDLLAERGVNVTYETIRQWSIKFGAQYARRLKRRQGRLGDTWYLDEMFVSINGQRQYLWRAVDQDGDVLDILVQPRRAGRAARRFFRKLVKSQRREPFRLVTDKLGSYRVAHREIMPSVTHDTSQYANNRAELSHQPTRQRKRHMRRFKSPDQAQRFLHVHGVIQNLFRLGGHRLRAAHHRMLRGRAFGVWAAATAA
jgi:putative transposase